MSEYIQFRVSSREARRGEARRGEARRGEFARGEANGRFFFVKSHCEEPGFSIYRQGGFRNLGQKKEDGTHEARCAEEVGEGEGQADGEAEQVAEEGFGESFGSGWPWRG